jgi:predicted MFS family arabinose efflux permease
MVLLGTGEIFGGQCLGFIRDKMNNRVSLLAEILLCICAYAIVIIYNYNNEFNYLAYIMCFVWGFQDSGLNCLTRCVLGFEFESKITPFSVFNFV